MLTKPLGTGIVATAVKKGVCPPEVLRDAVEWMAKLNRVASEAATAAGVTAATDVTGYGLTGHLGNMLRASGVAAEVEAARVPLLEGSAALARAGHVPGGTKRNQTDARPGLRVADGVDETAALLLSDAQTSGGLLLSCPPEHAPPLLRELEAKGELGAMIGRITSGPPGRIAIT